MTVKPDELHLGAHIEYDLPTGTVRLVRLRVRRGQAAAVRVLAPGLAGHYDAAGGLVALEWRPGGAAPPAARRANKRRQKRT